MKTDVSLLFTRTRHKNGNYSIKNELTDIKNDKKAMSMFLYLYNTIILSNYSELKNEALTLGLLVIERLEKIDPCDDRLTQIRVFVTKPNELWRIPAYILTRKIMDQHLWSDGAECLESSLLGYKEAEIEIWLSEIKKTRINWNGITVYFLIEKTKINILHHLGSKALSRDCINDNLSIYFAKDAIMKRDAISNLDPDETFCRCSLDQMYCEKLLAGAGMQKKSNTLTKIIISAAKIPDFNMALRSNINVLTEQGWV